MLKEIINMPEQSRQLEAHIMNFEIVLKKLAASIEGYLFGKFNFHITKENGKKIYHFENYPGKPTLSKSMNILHLSKTCEALKSSHIRHEKGFIYFEFSIPSEYRCITSFCKISNDDGVVRAIQLLNNFKNKIKLSLNKVYPKNDNSAINCYFEEFLQEIEAFKSFLLELK